MLDPVSGVYSLSFLCASLPLSLSSREILLCPVFALVQPGGDSVTSCPALNFCTCSADVASACGVGKNLCSVNLSQA